MPSAVGIVAGCRAHERPWTCTVKLRVNTARINFGTGDARGASEAACNLDVCRVCSRRRGTRNALLAAVRRRLIAKAGSCSLLHACLSQLGRTLLCSSLAIHSQGPSLLSFVCFTSVNRRHPQSFYRYTTLFILNPSPVDSFLLRHFTGVLSKGQPTSFIASTSVTTPPVSTPPDGPGHR